MEKIQAFKKKMQEEAQLKKCERKQKVPLEESFELSVEHQIASKIRIDKGVYRIISNFEKKKNK